MAGELHLHRLTVGHWRRRFQEARLDGSSDEPRPGALCGITDAMVERVITDTLRNPCSLDDDALEDALDGEGDGPQPVRRRAHLEKPLRASTAPALRHHSAIQGLPPSSTRCATSWGSDLALLERAWVSCVDEKAQIEALDRTASVLPMRPGLDEWCARTTTCATAPTMLFGGARRQGRHGAHRGVSCAAPGARIPWLSRHHRGSPSPLILDADPILDNYVTYETCCDSSVGG